MGNAVIHFELMSVAGNMLFYVLVDDIAAFRKKIVGAGGKIHVDEQQVPGMGAFCSPTRKGG